MITIAITFVLKHPQKEKNPFVQFYVGTVYFQTTYHMNQCKTKLVICKD